MHSVRPVGDDESAEQDRNPDDDERVREVERGPGDEIEAALGRIDDGTYGRCVNCGRPIAAERLEAVPYATLCIDDKRAVESGA